MTDSIEVYLQNRGAACPVCGSTDLVPLSDPDRSLINIVHEDIACDACGSSWRDVYVLAGYTDLVSHSNASQEREYVVTLMYPLDTDETYVNTALVHSSEAAIDAVLTMAIDANPDLCKNDFLCVSCVHVEDGKIVVDV